MRVLVCGGRDFNDWGMFCREMIRLANQRGKPTLIIEGGARGADRFARSWATGYGIDSATYPADWKAKGKAAGPIRNARMLDDGKPDLVVAFPGGRGTADLIRQARARNVEVIEVPALTAGGGE